MKNRTLLLSAILLAFLFSCGQASDHKQISPEVNTTTEKLEQEQAADSTTGNGGSGQSPAPDAPPSAMNWDKKIVKTATLNAEVKDYKVFSASLYEKVKRSGGYVSTERQNQTEYKIENSVTIRIPVDRFEAAMNELLSGAATVNEKTITSEDLTGEFVDGRSRLEAKKQVRLRYLELLKGAKNMAEILEVQQEINGIQEEIETVNGRLNFINHSSAMSTIHLTFYQILDPGLASKQKDNDGFLARFTSAFSDGWQWLSSLFIGIISLWPLALLSLPVFYAVRRWKRR